MTDYERVQAAVRRARSSGYGGWAQYETEELQRLLNQLLVPRGMSIRVSGVYGPSLCAAIMELFGPDTPLKQEIGSACYYPGHDYSQYIIKSQAMPTQQSYVSSAESGGLITDEPAPVPTTQPARSLDSFCDAPQGVCFADPRFGEAFRRSMRLSCASYPRDQGGEAYVGAQVKGLGVVCPPPITDQITQANAPLFYQTYGPCVLKDIPDCVPKSFTPCPLGSGACIDSRYQDILDTAVTQCQYGVTPPYDPTGCPAPNGVVTPTSSHRYSPCELAKLPMCGELSMDIPLGPFTSSSLPPEEEDDNTKYVIGGLLGLLAVGGIAYAVTRKRKGKKRKKR